MIPVYFTHHPLIYLFIAWPFAGVVVCCIWALLPRDDEDLR